MKFWKKGFKRGGVHLPEYKEFTEKKGLNNAPVPKKVKIPLFQHIGKPAIAVVKVGDEVKEGDLIGKRDGDLSANVHASIPGKITGMGDIFLPNGQKSGYVEIEFNGTFKKWNKLHEDWGKFSRQELIEMIREAGIVGLGGAAFPSHVKYTPPKKVESLLINGAECEPFLTVDDRLMQEKAEALVTGIKILQKALNPKKTYVGIEDNKKEAIEIMRKAGPGVYEVVELRTRYPQGGEKQLIEAILNRELPTGRLPFEIGVVATNVGTLFAVYEAVIYEKPLIERLVTISGQIVKWPGNYKVRIGTLIETLLRECHLFTDPAKVVVGGPMMGTAQFELDIPVIKGTSGILVFSEEEIKPKKETPCIRCGRCLNVCPAGLYPTVMYHQIQTNRIEESLDIGLKDCIECGACSYICPSKIKLVNYFKSAKMNIRANRSFSPNQIPVVQKGWNYEKEGK
jgi:electron transport complex protein RnfC